VNVPTDYLFRIYVKALIVNDAGKILAVKESGRTYWDLPGGGIDAKESVRDALARELAEEAQMTGEFEYNLIDFDEPVQLKRIDAMQMRLVFYVKPKHMSFAAGRDSDEVAFIRPLDFKDADDSAEKRIYEYWQTMNKKRAIIKT